MKKRRMRHQRSSARQLASGAQLCCADECSALRLQARKPARRARDVDYYVDGHTLHATRYPQANRP